MRIVRCDTRDLKIKVQSRGQYSHGWKILEKFKTKRELEERMKELLKDKNTVEG